MQSGDVESAGRVAAEQLGMLAAACALNATAPEAAHAFARLRLEHPRGGTFGAVRLSPDETSMLLGRALPSE
jgi:hypothetical protein